jgi:signal transduction histidine kinase
VADPERGIGVRLDSLGVPDAEAALMVPLVYRGTTVGALLAFDRLTGDVRFTHEDEQLLEAFAASAATAVATAKTVEADRLRRSLEAAEAERRRWARELHDETLQALGGLKVLLSGAGRLDDPEAMRAAMAEAVGHVSAEIESLRALIAELRPPALDQLGLEPALASLVQRSATTSGLEIAADVRVGGEHRRLAPELETTVYRLVQEALTNVAKHARATTVSVSVREADGIVDVRVADDGAGLRGGSEGSGGFGLVGMRERVELAGGELRIEDGPAGGTVVRARLPVG